MYGMMIGALAVDECLLQCLILTMVSVMQVRALCVPIRVLCTKTFLSIPHC
jgi:hypothetical protein